MLNKLKNQIQKRKKACEKLTFKFFYSLELVNFLDEQKFREGLFWAKKYLCPHFKIRI